MSRIGNRTRWWIGLAVIALACAGAAAATTGLVSGSEPGFDACVEVDLSHSSGKARAAYLAAFEEFATEAGMRGSGNLYVVLAGADPGADGTAAFTSVAPDDDGADAAQEVELHVAQAAEDLRKALLHPPVKGGASAIAEGALQCAKVLQPGDRMQLLSDGMQKSPVTGSFYSRDLSDAGIAEVLAALRGDHLLAHLEGVGVSAPLLLHRVRGKQIPAPRQRQVIRFWHRWAGAAGATLRD